MWGRILFLLLLASSAQANTFYVDPSALPCSNANTGTSPSAPWCSPPGTRTLSNSGFVSTNWGAITTTNKIQCGDVILLRGGATQNATIPNGQQHGAWRIASGAGEYYTEGCDPVTGRIQLRIATAAEWPTSGGHFTVNPAGMSATTPINQRRGIIAIISTDSVTFGGLNASSRLRVVGQSADTSDFVAGVLITASSGIAQYVEAQWLEVRDNLLADFGDSGVLLGFVEDSIIRDVLISDMLKMGVFTGPFSGAPIRSVGLERVEVRRSGPRPGAPGFGGNNPQDAFQLGCAPWLGSKGGGGGLWVIDPIAADNHWNGFIGGGSNYCADEVIRVVGGYIVGNGREQTPAFDSARTGYEHGAFPYNDCNQASQAIFMFIGTRWYGNHSTGSSGDHGGGITSYWHNTFLRGGVNGAAIVYHRDACHEERKNSIFVEDGQVLSTSCGNCGACSGGCGFGNIQEDKPDDNGNLYHFTTNGTQSLAGYAFVGSPETYATQNVTFNGGHAAGGHFGPNTLISSDTTPHLPAFVNQAGTCALTNFDPGNMEARFLTCNLGLTATSKAIGIGVPYLRANGSGTNSTALTVKDNGQILTRNPHAADPRKYLREPDSYWHMGICSNATTTRCSLNSECGAGTCLGQIVRVAGMSCAAGTPSLGAERAYITNMTATTITLDRSCTWANNAGVHQDYAEAIDAGFLDFNSGASSTTSTTSTSSTSTTSTSTSTSTSSTSTTTTPGATSSTSTSSSSTSSSTSTSTSTSTSSTVSGTPLPGTLAGGGWSGGDF